MAAGRGFMDAPAPHTTSTEPSHGRRDPAFVQKDQSFGRDRAKLRDEFLTPLEVGVRVLLAAAERLFFSRGPNLRSRYQIQSRTCC
jgi:hypothetical protein